MPNKGKKLEKSVKVKKSKAENAELFTEPPTPVGSGFTSLESFYRLKKARAKWLGICCAIVGGSVTLLGGFGLFVFAKLTERSFAWYRYLVSGFGVGAVVSLLLLLCAYPTTKRLSKKLDKKHAMQERVQTMVEFAEEEGTVIDLQRADAERRIARIPLRKKGFWAVCRLLLLPLLAVAMTVTALAIPAKEAPQPEKPILPGEEIYESDVTQINTLKKLISDVQKSHLTEDLKPAYLTVLQSLLTLVEEGKATTIQVKAAAFSAMQFVVDITTEKGTNNAFVAEISKSGIENLEVIAKALKDCRKAYAGINGINLYSYESFGDKQNFFYTNVDNRLNIFEATVTTEINALADENSYKAWANGYASALQSVLESASIAALPEEEEVKTAFVALQKDIASTVDKFDEGYVLGGVKSLAAGAFDGFHNAVAEVLTEQAYSYAMQQHVVHVLDRLFKCGMPETEEGEEGGNDLPGDSSEEESGGEAAGGGEMEYPNAGEILDPATGEYVPYYELITAYREIVEELLKNPDLSEEIKAQIKAYFDGLLTDN